MAYLNCPSCGLSFRVQAMDLVVENCPRCLARAHRVSRLLLSNEPHVISRIPLGSPPDSSESLGQDTPPAVHVPAEIPLEAVAEPGSEEA